MCAECSVRAAAHAITHILVLLQLPTQSGEVCDQTSRPRSQKSPHLSGNLQPVPRTATTEWRDGCQCWPAATGGN